MDDVIEQVIERVEKFRTIKQYVVFFFTVMVLFCALLAIHVFFHSGDDVKFIREHTIPELILPQILPVATILFASLLILYGLVRVPEYQRKLNSNNRKGNIWYFKLYDDKTNINWYRFQRVFHNVFHFLFALLFVVMLSYVFIAIFGMVYYTVEQLATWMIPTAFIPFLSLAIVSMGVCLIFWNQMYASYLPKRSVFVYMTNRYKHSKEKKIYALKVVLPYIRNYSLKSSEGNVSHFSKKLVRHISLYYEHVVFPIFSDKKTTEDLLPSLFSAILSDNYKTVLNHFKHIDKAARKNKNFKQHIKLLSTINKDINDMDQYKISSGLESVHPSRLRTISGFFQTWITDPRYRDPTIVVLVAFLVTAYLLGWLNIPFTDNGLTGQDVVNATRQFVP